MEEKENEVWDAGTRTRITGVCCSLLLDRNTKCD